MLIREIKWLTFGNFNGNLQIGNWLWFPSSVNGWSKLWTIFSLGIL